MEEIRDEPQTDKAIETSKTEKFSQQSLASLIAKTYTEEEYLKMSEEQRVEVIATQDILKVLSQQTKPLTSEDQGILFARVKRKIMAERHQYRQVLNEAEEEIKNLKWNMLVPFMNIPVRGIQAPFIITFGNFVMAKDEKWIYRPIQHQLINSVRRWRKKKDCERVANEMRENLKPSEVDDGKEVTYVDSIYMRILKQDLLERIKEIKEVM